jgi:AcrR family transcriptional regulator
MARAIDTRERLVQTTMQLIDELGENAVRLREVAEAVGVKESSIYHHFENRESLLEVAQIERYRRSYLEMIMPLRMAVEMAETREEFETAVRKVLEWSYKPDREPIRSVRAHVMGLAQSSDSMATRVREVNGEICSGVAEVFVKAQDRKWMRADLDPLALAYWSISQLNGRVMAEMDPIRVDIHAWDHVSITAVMLLINPNQ